MPRRTTAARLPVAPRRWTATCARRSRRTPLPRGGVLRAVIDEQRVAGYYTLVSASLLLSDLPASMAKKLPRYPTVPAVRMERLAVDQAHKGLGGALLADALHRAARSEIAAYATDGDAKGEAAAAFYQYHGFIALPDSPLKLFLPLATVR